MLSYTLIIILINVIISILSFNNENLKTNLIFSPFEFSLNKKWWIVISHGFVHADFLHLFFNMYVLYIFGSPLEYYFATSSEIGIIFFDIIFFGYNFFNNTFNFQT